MSTGEPEIKMDELVKAVMELNLMSPCDGVMMTRGGEVKVGYRNDKDTLCELISAEELARMLTASDLSSYTEKELRQWVREMDIAPLEAKVKAALLR